MLVGAEREAEGAGSATERVCCLRSDPTNDEHAQVTGRLVLLFVPAPKTNAPS